jgi:glycosyltransferase involved in cell wall biosynthesis
MLITIIIPTKNRCSLLQETLDSVLAQTYSDWEVIVVDDGSEDGTIEILESLTDERIRFIKRDSMPSGAPACRNIGAENAQGEHLIFLDSDDLLLPHALERRAQLMESNLELDFAAYVGEMFVASPGDQGVLWNIPTGKPDFDRFLGLDVSWQTSGPIWRAEFFHRIGGWAETLLCGQDSELHLRALSFDPHYQYCVEVDYAIRAGNVARQSVGGNWKTVEGQLSHAQSVIKLCQSDRGRELNSQQRSIAAGRLLYHAIHIMKISSEDGRDDAYKLWKNAREYHLIPFSSYLLGCLWISKYRLFWGDLAAYLINHLESEDFLLKNRARLASTPISCLEEDPYDGRFHKQDSFVSSGLVRKGLLPYMMGKLRRKAALL